VNLHDFLAAGIVALGLAVCLVMGCVVVAAGGPNRRERGR